MIWLLFYLGIGLVNASPILLAMLSRKGSLDSWLEAVFWVLLWPLQLLYWLLVKVPSHLLSWLGERGLIP